jgi:zinc transport system substrate-binding protein
MRFIRFFLFLIVASFLIEKSVAEVSPKVVASIRPLHSLISGVMEGVGEPELLVKNFSPHTFSLSPLDMKILDRADIVFWIGESLEGSLLKPLHALKKDSLVLIELPGLKLLHQREGHHWHHDHHEGHHHHGGIDPHIWLDPDNAIVMIKAIQEKLSTLDSNHKSLYEKNTQKLILKLKELKKDLSSDLKGLDQAHFLVFHDGYHYFENAFHLQAAGAFTANPEVPLSLKKLLEIKKLVETEKIICLFAEPQFSSSVPQRVSKDLGISLGVLNYLGVQSQDPKQSYFDMMTQLAKSFKQCLDHPTQPQE